MSVPVTVATPAKQARLAAWGCFSVVVLCLFLAWCGSQMATFAPSQTGRATATQPPLTTTAPAPTPAPVPEPAPEPAPKLALLSSRGYEDHGYFIVEGRVKNISSESLENVTAKAQWFDKNDNFITADDALIDYNPILPGQTSPFKTMTRGNPAMSRFRVDFAHLMGGTILTDDRSKKK